MVPLMVFGGRYNHGMYNTVNLALCCYRKHVQFKVFLASLSQFILVFSQCTVIFVGERSDGNYYLWTKISDGTREKMSTILSRNKVSHLILRVKKLVTFL